MSGTLQTARASLVLAVLMATAQGQSLIQNLGGQRVGTSVFAFLKIDASVYGSALGGAAVAIPSDASGLYYNPAIITHLSQSNLVVARIQWPADITYDHFALSLPVGRHQYLALSYGILQTEPMLETTEHMPFGTGRTFTFRDQLAALTYALRVTDRFSVGTTVKYVTESLADIGMSALLFDFGTYYLTGFNTLRISSSFSNFGRQVAPVGTFMKRILDGRTGEEVEAELNYQAFSPPTTFRLGAAYEVIDADHQQLTMAVQLTHPADNAEYYAVGMNYQLGRSLSLRAGYQANTDEFGLTLGLSIGASFKGGQRVRFDYAYSQTAFLTPPQRISIGFSL